MPTTATLQRRDTLRTRLVSIAEATIRVHGVQSLKARDLAASAGCSVGAIYNVFGDLSDLVLVVNSRTFSKMGEELAKAVAAHAGNPTDELVGLSVGYLSFARSNTNQWRALFEAESSNGEDAPDWYNEQLGGLFGEIGRRVKLLHPNMADSDVTLMSRTLFSTAHGMVSLGLEGRQSGVPLDELERMIGTTVRALAQIDKF